MSRRVVVTGLGLVTPVGHNVKDSWEAIVNGKSGVDKITRYDASTYNVQIAAEVKNWDAADYMDRKEKRRRDRYQLFIRAAADQAIQDAGLELQDGDGRRTAVIVGSAVGGVESYYEQAKLMIETNDPRRITPFGIPMLMVNGGSDMMSIEVGATGPSYTPISACATGADCIGHAFDLIRLGRMDRALAGCGEAPIIPIGIAAFDRVGACSRQNDDPLSAVRPFDKDRTGLVFSEGAGVMVLEELEHAKARGAQILAELVGYGSTSDAFHITAPHPEAHGAIEAIKQALDDAQIAPEQIDYINAHGTATELNDIMETKAVKQVFGEHAYNIPMSSTKSMTGHAMGATAAFEAIFSIMALRDQVAPPTINFNEADPECDLDYIPNEARELKLSYVMSNSFGFGGHNVSLIFKKFEN
ncbi:MAG: beta-ketoacyl-[acyl-carrier-protein] synthase II [Chloroflexi bacterium]|nr:MAG: beta-ketoacyl-[acyl-carrier-protein] synthase II [Phototrophicales bacterium]RMF81943.1 MAG: beta-ketoacyl-[acyl-carrier-protein] synthase II [Chloroflexota bacterium]